MDWAWPTLGAAWIDPAGLALWLIASGHQPAAAEAWLRTVPTARDTSSVELDAFTRLNARLWTEIAEHDPQAWKMRLADAATRWDAHRHG